MRVIVAVALVVSAFLAGSPAHAADLKVLTTGAFRPILAALTAEFQQRTGDTLVEAHDTAGRLLSRIESGEKFDVAILTAAGIVDLAARGKVRDGEIVRLARVGIGVVVKDGTPVPVVDSVEAFRQALIEAPSVAYIDPARGGSSGVYLEQLFRRLGVAEQIKAKSVLVPGGLVAERVVHGDAALGLHQISEILAVKGAHLAGPLPDEIQNYTIYAGGISSQTTHADAALRLLNFLQSAPALALLKEKGVAPPRE